jgi:NADH:ubiquinone oxidoreductase subunit
MTIGTWLFTKMRGELVGTDAEGNRYFQDKRVIVGMRRKRWVIYNGVAEASRVPPEWHGWLHYTFDTPPTEERYRPRPWEKAPQMNMTGTAEAYRPSGSILGSAERPKATGDYKPWRPQ